MRKFVYASLILIAACSAFRKDHENDPLLARVYDEYLYASEARKILPENVSSKDSVTLIQNYINNWVQQRLILRKAKENLTPEEQDFTRQLEEYRNSLLLYEYERKIIGQKLDTDVLSIQIESYYRQNKDRFELKGNIAKFDFVKVPLRSRQLREFRRLLNSTNPLDSLHLEEYCEKYSTDYWLAREWVSLNDLLNEIPLEPDNQENFLRRTKFAEAKDSLYWYLLRINDYKTTDSVPPLAFESENIRNIILNTRKLKLIDKLHQDIIDEAFKSDNAQIY